MCCAVFSPTFSALYENSATNPENSISNLKTSHVDPKVFPASANVPAVYPKTELANSGLMRANRKYRDQGQAEVIPVPKKTDQESGTANYKAAHNEHNDNGGSIGYNSGYNHGYYGQYHRTDTVFMDTVNTPDTTVDMDTTVITTIGCH